MPGRILKTEQDVRDWGAAITSQLPVTASFTRGAKRTNPQNKTIHLWYAEAALHLDVKPEDVRAECKLIHGVPILRRDDDAFRLEYDRDFRPLNYETKLRLFRLLDPAITSRMNVKQLTEYMDAMQGHFLPMGIRLTDPEARKYEAMQ